MNRLAVILLTTFSFGSWSSSDVPTFSVSYPHYVYSQPANGIRDIEFRNFGLVIFDDAGGRLLEAKLKEGFFEHKYSIGTESVKLISVEYFDVVNGEPSKALVTADYFASAGSSSDFGVVQVFEVDKGHPFVLQQIKYNGRGEGVGSSFDAKTEILMVKGVHGWEHCCATTLDVGTFDWNGSKFVLRKSISVPMVSAQ